MPLIITEKVVQLKSAKTGHLEFFKLALIIYKTMPYCENCGNKLSETTKFCSKCGEKVKTIEEQDLGERNER